MNILKVFAILLLGFASSAHAASFTASASGNWNIGTTWGGGCSSSCTQGTDYPGPSDTATIGAYTVVTLTANQNVNTLNLSGGTLNMFSYTLNVSGNISITSGTLNANTSTVIMNGTSGQTITSGGQTFNNIQITNTNSGGVSFEDSTTISGELIVNVPGAVVNFEQGATHTVSGAFIVHGQAAAKVGINSVNGLSAFTLSVGTANVWINANIANLTKSGAGSITADLSTNSGNNTGVTFNAMPTAWVTNQSAAVVIGQANMTSSGTGDTAYNMNGPNVVYSDGVNLYVADQTNSRVLIFTTIPASNNASANVVVGQANMTSGASGLTAYNMNIPKSVYSDGVNLYVADYSNNRVLIFTTIPTTNNASANVVVGQADMISSGPGDTAYNMSGPYVVYSDGVKLYVADENNNRVLIFNTIPASNNASANVVVGQANMTSQTSGVTAYNMNFPTGVYSDGVKLYVADYTNNRVLIFNTVPTTNNASANVVVGQVNMASSGTGVTAYNMNNPHVAYSDGVKLYVADYTNNRVLIFNTVPTTNNASADVVVGQANMTSNGGAATANSMYEPIGVYSDGLKLYVADRGNNRVLLFNSQSSVTISGTVYSDAGITPLGSQTVEVAVNGVDTASTTSAPVNGFYSVTTAAANIPAGAVVTVYLKGMSADAVTVTVSSGANLSGVNLYKNYLIVRQDNGGSLTNSNLATAATGGGADVSNIYTVSGTTLTLPAGESLLVWTGDTFAPGGNIYAGGNVTLSGTFTPSTYTVYLNGTAGQTVTSGGNSFNALFVQNTKGAVSFADALTTSNFTVNVPSASLQFEQGLTHTVSGTFIVQGQVAAKVSINSVNGLSAFTLSVGTANVWSNANIANLTKAGAGSITANLSINSGNNTGVTFNPMPTSWVTNQSAAVVVGQANMTSTGAGTTAYNMADPYVPYTDGLKLYVTDYLNSRVLIFNTVPTSNNASANVVVGQANMTSNGTGATAYNLNNPSTVFSDGVNLYVSDVSNNRVLIFNTIPTSNNASANVVVGQANMTSNGTGHTAYNMGGMILLLDDGPAGIYSDGVKLYVADSGNNRVLIFNTIPTSNNASANVVVGQANMTSNGSGATAYNMYYPAYVYTDGVKLYVADFYNNRVLIFNTIPTTNNASADVVVGQANMTSNGTGHTAYNMGGMILLLDVGPSDVYTDGVKLYVADGGNNRVLIFNTIPTSNNASASVVLGQANMTSTVTTPVSATSMNTPVSVYSEGVKLYVGDSGNNRVLIFNSQPSITISGTVYSDAGVTPLGSQTVMVAVNGVDNTSTTSASNGAYSVTIATAAISAGAVVTVYLKGGPPNAVTVTVSSGANLSGVNLYENYLIVRQDNGGSLTNSNLATAATGGGTDVSNIYTVSGTTLTLPAGISLLVWTGDTFAPGGNIYAGGNVTLNGTFTPSTYTVYMNGTGAQTVTSGGNSFNALFVQNTSGAVSFADALTTSTFTVNVPSASLKFEQGLTHTVSGAFIVQGQAAAKVSINSVNGSSTFTLSVGTANVWLNANIANLTKAGSGSITADLSTNSGNNTGVTFNVTPTFTTNQSAAIVVGQANMTSSGSGVTAYNMHLSDGIYSDGVNLYVTDNSNNRVLIFNTIPASNNASANVVVGQANMNSSTPGTTAYNMSSPYSVYSDGVRMYVAESTNNRVLIFNTIPTTNNASANVVVGQANMTSNASGVTAYNMSGLYVVYSDGVKLYVADSTNNRVLIFNTIPASNNASANVVVGQANMNSSTPGTTAYNMNYPTGVYSDGVKLYVADFNNSRILIFNTIPASNNASANVVVGQANMTSNGSGVTAYNMDNSTFVYSDGVKLYVTDRNNNRALIFNTIPTTNNASANVVVGQANMTSNTSGLTASNMHTPFGAYSDGLNLYVTDSANNRVLLYNSQPSITISGTVYSDAGVTPFGSQTVELAVNGVDNTSTTSAGDGTYSVTIATAAIPAGAVVTVYLKGMSADAVTVTVSSGANLSGVDLYKNYLIVRQDNGGSLTNSNLATAATGGGADVSNIYTVSGTTLTLPAGMSLLVWTGDTFAPGGNIYAGGNVTLSGTFTPSTYTVYMNGTGAQTVTSGGNSFNTLFVQNTTGAVSFADALTTSNFTVNVPSASLQFEQGLTHIVSGAFIVRGQAATKVSINSVNGSSAFTLSVGTANVWSNASIANLTKAGAGSITADLSTNSGNNTGVTFNPMPTTWVTNQSAAVVVGQANMTSSGPAATVYNMNNPTDVYSDGMNLYVTDTNNNRVLIFNTIPASNNASANVVVGQANMTSSGCGVTAYNMNAPDGVNSDGVNLYVSEYYNNRILIFNTMPTTNNASANVVVGQANMTSSVSGLTAYNIHNPQGVYSDGVKLYVTDTANNRVLIFNTIPASNNASANVVVGQANMTSSASGVTAYNMWDPSGVYTDGVKLYVADISNDRVLIFNTVPTSNNASANVVVGQANMTFQAPGDNAYTMNGPAKVYSDGVKLYVADDNNNRILIFNTIPTSNNASANVVVGQANMNSSASGLTASNMHTTQGVYTDGVNLYVADRYNNRVLLFNSQPSVTISGTVYSDAGITPLGSQAVELAVNGSDVASTTSSADGFYSITTASANIPAGAVVTVYLKGMAVDGVTVTVSSGANLSGVNLYENYLIVRQDNGGSLTNSNLATAATSGGTDVSNIYTVSGTTLTLPAGKSLLVWTGDTFAPGGNIYAGGDITLSGTFTPSTYTVYLNGTGAQTVTSGGSSFNALFVQNTTAAVSFADALTTSTFTVNVPSASLKFEQGMTHTVSGAFIVRGQAAAKVSINSVNGSSAFTLSVGTVNVWTNANIANLTKAGAGSITANLSINSGGNIGVTFNATPIFTTNQSAVIVVGQTNMTSNGSADTAYNMSNPTGVYSDGVNLYVADFNNNRVLIFNTIPASNNASANVVVGQANMTSGATGVTAYNMNGPDGVYSDGVNLYVADFNNNRVLIFNTIPASNNASANVVVGQANMTSSASGLTAYNMYNAPVVYSDGVKLYVADKANNRVLIFNTIPASNNASANVVVGQANMTSSTTGVTAYNMNYPDGVYSDGVKLYVADFNNNRVLIFNTIPASNNASANVVVGQANMTSNATGVTAYNMVNPIRVYSDGVKLYVGDGFNHRVLIFNTIPVSNNASANVVVGQANMTSGASGVTAYSMGLPASVYSDGVNLYVADGTNDRILLFNNESANYGDSSILQTMLF